MSQPGDVGLDFAWSKPSIAAIKAYGATFVSRYLCWLPSGKVITKAECDSYLTAGIDVALNWEFRALDQQGGAAAGTRHGAESYRQARALGAPAGTVIYASADWDVQAADLPTCRAYWAAFAAELKGFYRFGVYGGLRVVADALAQGYHGWQTYAWSHGVWSNAHVRQVLNGVNVGGADCDRDVLIRPDAGLIEGASGDVELTDKLYVVGDKPGEPTGPTVNNVLSSLYARTGWMADGVDNDWEKIANLTVAKVLAALPPPSEDGGLSLAQVEAAVVAGVRQASAEAWTP